MYVCVYVQSIRKACSVCMLIVFGLHRRARLAHYFAVFVGLPALSARWGAVTCTRPPRRLHEGIFLPVLALWFIKFTWLSSRSGRNGACFLWGCEGREGTVNGREREGERGMNKWTDGRMDGGCGEWVHG